MRKYAVITVPPLLLFAVVLVAGEVLSAPRAEPADGPEPEPVAPAPEPAAEPEPPAPAAAREAPPPALLDAPARQGPDSLVPPHLEQPLKAVAPDISLCVSQSLERDRGPLDIDVRFTPTRAGSFAPGTQVTTSWDDEEVARCVAEVFEETTFWPSGQERGEPAEFVFHFPDDQLNGLLGLSYSPYY